MPPSSRTGTRQAALHGAHPTMQSAGWPDSSRAHGGFLGPAAQVSLSSSVSYLRTWTERRNPKSHCFTRAPSLDTSRQRTPRLFISASPQRASCEFLGCCVGPLGPSRAFYPSRESANKKRPVPGRSQGRGEGSAGGIRTRDLVGMNHASYRCSTARRQGAR